MKSLIFLEKEDKTQVPVGTFPFEVGSYDQYSKLTLDSPNVSPVHFLLIEEGNELILRELNTKIGVKVNDDLITNGNEVTLKNNDQLDIDGIKLKVIISTDLISQSELEEINSKYLKLLEASPESQNELAEEIAKTFWDKIVGINNQLKNKKSIKEQISDGFLKDILEEHIPQSQQTVKTKVETPENPIKSSSSSFRDRNRQRTFNRPIEGESVNNAVTQSRRLNIDKSKLGRPENFTKPKEPYSIVLKEVNPPYSTIKINKLPAKLGRSHELADVVIDKSGISRIHCIIDKGSGSFVVQDNNSTNGTYLNGNPVKNIRADIKLQDIISLYDHEYRVVELDES